MSSPLFETTGYYLMYVVILIGVPGPILSRKIHINTSRHFCQLYGFFNAEAWK